MTEERAELAKQEASVHKTKREAELLKMEQELNAGLLKDEERRLLVAEKRGHEEGDAVCSAY
jgi:hypothetical protein